MKFGGKVIIYGEKRKHPITAGYRPHLSLKGSENLLGIVFIEVDNSKLNQYSDCIIETSYDNVDYSTLVIDKTYDVREGRTVVGEIRLVKVNEENAS